VFKQSVNGAFANDISRLYLYQDLTGYPGNDLYWIIVIRNIPFDTLDEARYVLDTSVFDVSADPSLPIVQTRRCRYSFDFAKAPQVLADCIASGWADTDWATAQLALTDMII
ncbi:MAG: hypothetical protein OEY29_16140, partial [Gammaproteobacteria bacterium]|nr:hypothetical protein [Gammaproteobacteria bacterium]